MSIVGRLDEVLGPIRGCPAQRGVNVTFERGGRWRTMHVVEEPNLELSIAVPELADSELHAHLGPATVLGDGVRVDDPRWRVKTGSPALATAIFGEPPWPRGLDAGPGAAWPGAKAPPLTWRRALRLLGALSLGPFGYHLILTDDVAMADPVPLYVLDLERGVASIERREVEIDPARALGMVRRLVQVATWPDRVMGRLRDLAARLGGEVEGERWVPGTSAIAIRRGEATIRVDHELTRGALRTRIRVLDAADATEYLDGVECDPELVGRTIDALVAQAARRASSGPYR